MFVLTLTLLVLTAVLMLTLMVGALVHEFRTPVPGNPMLALVHLHAAKALGEARLVTRIDAEAPAKVARPDVCGPNPFAEPVFADAREARYHSSNAFGR